MVNSKDVNLLKSKSKEELVPDGLYYATDVFTHKYISLSRNTLSSCFVPCASQ